MEVFLELIRIANGLSTAAVQQRDQDIDDISCLRRAAKDAKKELKKLLEYIEKECKL